MPAVYLYRVVQEREVFVSAVDPTEAVAMGDAIFDLPKDAPVGRVRGAVVTREVRSISIRAEKA